MPVDPASTRSVAGDHDDPGDHFAPIAPAAVAKNDRGQSDLAVEGGKHRLQVRDHRLHLDDKRRPSGRLKGEDVGRSTFAVDLERDLELHDPACRGQHRSRRLDHRRVVCVEQPVELLATPEHANEHSSVEGCEQSFEKPDGESICLCSLDSCNR